MPRGRKGAESRRTVFNSSIPIMTVSKHAGRCKRCGLDLRAGDGYVYRAPGDSKWELTCKNGCKEMPYHKNSRADYEADRAEVLGELGEGLTPPWTTNEELRAEHG